MRVEVDQEKCISCGYCVNHCGEIFDWNADHRAEEEMGIVPKDFEDAATDAVENCPTHAILEVSDAEDPWEVDTTRDQDQSRWIID
jgi:ferredoxin